jgi:anti-sigma factor RsiW
MNEHDRYRDQLALRLYGELDQAETQDLEGHLADCLHCRSWALDLERGLGILASPGHPPAAALSAAWTDRLHAEIERQLPSPSRRAALLVPALAFAAGILVTLLFSRPASLEPARPSVEIAPQSQSFARMTPPDRAPTRGFFATLRPLGGQ